MLYQVIKGISLQSMVTQLLEVPLPIPLDPASKKSLRGPRREPDIKMKEHIKIQSILIRQGLHFLSNMARRLIMVLIPA